MPRAHGEGQRRQRIVSEMREVEKKDGPWVGIETCALLMIWKNRNSAEGVGLGLGCGHVASPTACRVVPFSLRLVAVLYAFRIELVERRYTMPSHAKSYSYFTVVVRVFTNRPISGVSPLVLGPLYPA
jgi:hypothetical protein